MAESLEDKKKRLEIEKLQKEVNQFYPTKRYARWQLYIPLLSIAGTILVLYLLNVFDINSKLIIIARNDFKNDTAAFNVKKAAIYYTIDSLTGVAAKYAIQLKTDSETIAFSRKDKNLQDKTFIKLKDENSFLKASVAHFVERLNLVDQNLNQSAADLSFIPPFLYSNPVGVKSVSNLVQRVHIRVNDTEKMVDSLRKSAKN